MSTSNPLNPHPQDAAAGDNAGAGIGGLQKAAGVRHADHVVHGAQHLIDKGYVPVRQLTGKVVGVWGDAHIRLLDGEVKPLHVGDVVKKGEVVLTAQDGIVQIEAHPTTRLATASDDVERVISQVNRGDADAVPAAGPNAGGASGSLQEGLRVGRDAESTAPLSLGFGPLAIAPQPPEHPQAQLPLTPPQANPDTEITFAGTPVTFDPRGNDTSTTAITIVAVAGHPIDPNTPVTLPQGTVSMNPDGSLTFTPNPGVSGSTTFTYTDHNAAGGTSTSTVTVSVGAPTDHQPVAVADTFSGAENAPIAGNLAANNTPSADGGNVWSLAAGAAHGTVAVNADGSFAYTPSTGYHGPDSFTYTITDADGSTSTATVTLNVTPIAPVAASDTVVGTENALISGNLGANDTPVAGETNTWAVAGNPAHGTVVVNPDGTYTYTPAAGYNGPDAFTYTVTDGSGQSSTATVTLTVAPVAPVAANDALSVREDTPATGTLAANDTPVAGESNTWTLAGNAAHGSVTVNPDGTYSYAPAAGYTGTDSFTYTITDASGQTATATVTLNVAPIAPAAVDDTFGVHENTPSATLSVSGNDTPVAGEANTWSVASTTTTHGGTITLAPDFATSGNFTYTPASGYVGTDSFSYSITDHSGQTSTATVTLTVAPIAPVANPDAFNVGENATSGTLSVSANDVPVAGETNTWSVASTSTTHGGTITLAPDFATTGDFTYTPPAGYVGTDTFSYTITDHSGQTSTATVSLNVGAAAPIANPDAFNVNEDTTSGTLSISGNDTPVAGETNTWSVASTTTAQGGIITLAVDFATTGNFTYTPPAGYVGTDTFSYTITDHSGQTSTTTVTLTVAPIAPAANPDSFNVNEDTTSGTLSVKTNDTPVAGETNTWSIASTTTAHGGTITPAADFATTGNFTYTPPNGYVGTDTFSYAITDHSGQTSTTTVTLTVAPIAPVANPDSFNVNEDTTSGTLSISGNDTPVAGETNTWSIASTTTAHGGTITPAADFATTGDFTYTPPAGYVGTDTFSYAITDHSGQTSTATVSLNVGAAAPIANPDSFNVNEDTTSGTLSVSGNDTPVAGESNTWSVPSTTTAHGGTITPAADFATTGNFTYTPPTGYVGTDTFTYTITDHSGQTSTTTVTLTVAPIAPVANPDAFTVNEDTTSSTLSISGNDTPVAGETNTWSIASTMTSHGGTITPAADFATTGNFTYTPPTGYVGTDTFSYTITDHSGQTSTTTVTLTVAPIAPVANPDSFNVNEDTTSGTLSISGNDTPVAGETNTWSIASTTTAHGGTITPAADFATTGNFTYTPPAGYVGTDTFSYTITDHSGQTSTTTVTLTVAPIAPVAFNDSFKTNEDTTSGTLSVKTNDMPVAGEVNHWSVASTTTAHGGTITLASDFATSGNFTYTPASGFTGTDTFSYTITDASGLTSTATVALNVAPIAPIAVDDAFVALENSSTAALSVKTNDTPVAGEVNHWSVASTTTAHGGTITPASDFATTGNFTYTPAAGYSGTDTFTYTITDASGQTSAATVTLTVKPVPIAVDDSFTTNENVALTGNVSTNDTPAAGETNTWTLDTAHGAAHGTVSMNANGSFTYTPTANYSGTDSFNYIVTDSDGTTTTATATVIVDNVATAPTLTLDSHAYSIATTFDETSLAGLGYANQAVGGLTHGTETGGTTPDLAWHTDNGGQTIEVGLGGTYAVTGDSTQVMEIEQNLNDASNLYTSVNTHAGEVYTLSFDFAARNNGGASTNSVVYVYWEGQLVDTLNSTSAAMTHYTLDVMATTTGSSKLEFVAGDSNSYGGILDNVGFTLHQDSGEQGYIVNLPGIAAAMTNPDSTESLKVTIDTIPVGATLTDGTHTFTAAAGSTEADVSGWSLSSLTLNPPSSFTGDVTLGVHATSTESSNGSAATTSSSVTLHVLADTADVYGTTGDDALATTATGNDIRWGLDGNDTITGGSGHDTLVGGAGDDSLVAGSGATLLDGGTGNDHLVGGAGADTLSGGAGNDTLTGGGGVDVFKWHLGDQGTTTTPAVDTITDFNPAAVSAGGDVLDLRDLLVGESRAAGTTGAGDLTNYLHFTVDTAGDTVVHISTQGNGQEDQQIILTGVNLVGTNTDAQIITTLLGEGKLITNGH